ncbi:hypothetical protein Bca52824_091206 [Brassica carinata]|uniref:Cysteine-rich n=1 Tax=Brassica carinata TaxID=52824 RepID=A0A8X7NW34_BRACI|nr:PREDICTED: cysteine-rich receptor-like protein kinase 21 [Brassica oleracea var. oleracea]KAG2239975.1 hypothetical protein Bca52824_091206 [Brassica carinata]
MIDLSIVFWFVLIGSSAVSAQTCKKRSGVFTPNDTYDLNRKTMLSILPSIVSANDGFNKTSIGQEPNKTYGLGMCIPGTEPRTCSDCIMASAGMLLRYCPEETEATDWRYSGSLCLVRYSNRSFNGYLDEETMWKQSSNTIINSTEFVNTWDDLIGNLIDTASSKSNPKYYAAHTKQLNVSTYIYGFMQCTKYLTSWDCTGCLRQSVDEYRSCCRGSQGGSIARPSCFMRWELYPFLGLFDSPASPEDQANTTTKDGINISAGEIVTIVVVPIVVVTGLLALGFICSRRRRGYQAFTCERGYFSAAKKRNNSDSAPQDDDGDITTSGSHQFNFRAIKAATNNFQKSNKLGHGGFGAVYKGMFQNGTEVAAKRLSKTSGQGEQEFKNEVLLVAKLQHRNLVRLLGFSVERDERILVYEFVPNKSLDYFLFDHLKRGQLDWKTRLNIIEGITRGMLYLHQDSRLTIIHRDLKASNILLDADMNPKIADFGMARSVRVNQTEANTGRVVGTFGYMPPEYVANGHFSTKSDVYSFGVLLLEIIGGKKNSSFHRIDGSASNLVTYVWRLWSNESLLELVDPAIGENYDKDAVIRCIHIGLLCVQESPADRPSMPTIFQMLTNTSITLPVPQQPGFFFRERSASDPLAERLLPGPSPIVSFACSIDDASIASVSPR